MRQSCRIGWECKGTKKKTNILCVLDEKVQGRKEIILHNQNKNEIMKNYL